VWRGGGKTKEIKEKGGIRKGGVALALRTKIAQGTHAKLIYGKLLFEISSSFGISLRLYLVLLLKNFSLKVKMTKLSLESCCPASKFSSDCYVDQPVFMYVICARLMNCCLFQLVIG